MRLTTKRHAAIALVLSVVWGNFSLAAAADEIDFESDVLPILEDRCLYCHGEDEQESSLRLDSRASMLRGGDSGLATVVPGKPDLSFLIDAVNHRVPDFEMPPGEDKIPDEEIELLREWIEQGAVVPGQMEEVIRQRSDHWAFQPIEKPVVPVVNIDSSHPIDAFLQRKLAEQGLSFSAKADPHTLIRRVTIVLTGLTPTPREVDNFLVAHAIDPEEAYASLVDRLLESPHFGERWAQHWLDVIRWAETNGSESNMYRKNAWIYRDYVVRAFNEDKPYDQFLFEQLAGDTVGQGDATGFLVSGPHVPVATVGQEPAARRQARADRMDEVLQTVGASALGITVGCARCHNHKFDPVSIRDYYAMSAVFQDVEFGSRFPELAEDHPRRLRGEELYAEIDKLRDTVGATGSWEEHWTAYREVHFAPVKTQVVRVSFLWNSAFIDELEIFGTEQPDRNLALGSEGTTTTSPSQMAMPRKELWKINDGEYGTEQWAARAAEGSDEKPWVQFTLPDQFEIDRIRLSSNREDFFETDYLEGLNDGTVAAYRIEIQTEDGSWRQVAATPQYRQLNESNEERADALNRIQELIQLANEQGPKPSFVGRFVEPVETYVLARGSPENPRDEVQPAGLEELEGRLELDANAPGWERRAAFAHWLIDPDHPLTARVATNRLWHHVFGQGIVSTPSDFGTAGAMPTHPELLDWLACELMHPSIGSDAEVAQAWSMKHMIRLMVMSHAFRQSSLPNEQAMRVDASSTLLWRFPIKRVEAEVIRDSILLASAQLDRTLGGRSYRIHNVKKRYGQWEVVDNFGPQTWRRMIYQERMRRVDDQIFTAFDFPDCGQIRPQRPESTTPLQALNLLNSEFVMQQSQLIAERALDISSGDLSGAVDECFRLLLGREPTDQEREDCLQLANQISLSLVARALINSNEFAFLQ